jgi:hypothetical protein
MKQIGSTTRPCLSSNEVEPAHPGSFHGSDTTDPESVVQNLAGAGNVYRKMCRTIRAAMRQYGLFRYFCRALPCGLSGLVA